MTTFTSALPAPAGATRYWWQGAVIYECHLPSFRDGDGDGIGDLAGLTASLDYLRGTLGVDAVWTGPFYRSPLLDQGFDVTDHTAVEPVFGTLETVRRLIAEAHRRGLRVIVDYIPNHTSDRHPWFVESRSSRTNQKRDWYVWRDGRDGGFPNNWTSEAGGSVWEWDEPTGQYYLHSHLKEQPDLNWRNPQVRRAMLDVLRYWLDQGVDGFRIDVAHMLMKDPQLRDNPPAPPGGNHNPFDLQHPDFGSQLHLHDRRHPDVHQALAEIRAVVDDYPGAVTIAEIEAMSWQDWAAYYGEELAGMHLPFPFRLIETHWRAPLLRQELEGLYAALPPGAWPIVALGNHDRVRLATRLGAAQARVAAMLLLTVAVTPCLLYGDELGLPDQPVPPERQRDYFARVTGGVSRDPTRTPMPWEAGPNAGFSTADEPALWLPVARDADRLHVAAQLADPGSMLSLYRELLSLRHASPAIRHGGFGFLAEACTEGTLGYQRRFGADRKAVVLNLTGAAATVPLEPAGRILLSTTDTETRGWVGGGQLRLAGDEAMVIEIEQERDGHEDH